MNAKPYRLLLTALQVTPYVGGLERAFLLLVDGIPRNEFTVKVALAPGMDRSRFGAELIHRGVPLIFIKDVLSKRDLKGMGSMIAALRRERPDICHIHMTHPVANPFLQIAAWLSSVPVIISTEQTNVLIAQQRFGRVRKWFTGRITDANVAVSQAVKHGLCEHYRLPPERVVVIENAIDARSIASGCPDDVSMVRRELGISEDAFVIGTVAALRDQKGHAYLIQAVPRVVRELPDAVFLFIGDGDLRPVLEREACELGVTDHVVFAGWRTDVTQILYATDLFVLPSLWEGLPLAVLEAMAAARPVVATAVDGTAEVIETGVDGVLVPPADPEALSGATLRIARDPELASRLGKAGRAKALARYDGRVMVDRYLEVYRRQLALRCERRP